MISILLPSLNQEPFLEERFATIRAQTVSDWELIVIDGFSDDGSWEFIQREAARDRRIRAFQAPRRGFYAALNLGLRESGGELVYVATADDAMTADCLEKLVAALERHPECGLAHCRLAVIDAAGGPVERSQSWGEQPVPKFYFGDWMGRAHVRPRLHDGFLHAATGTVYNSLNQLLIRRALFDRAGLFREDLGAKADFEWGMRASLLTATVHVPETLASWRRHPAQLTRDDANTTPASRREMAAMVAAAVGSAVAIDGALRPILDVRRLTRPFRHQAWLFEREQQGGGLRLLLDQWLREPDLIPLDLRNRWLWRRRYHRCHLDFIRREMRRRGVPGPVPEGPIPPSAAR